MAAEGGNNIVRYIYRGEESEIIPREATHITVIEGVTFVHAGAFFRHPNIVEVICHEDVEKIEREAFYECPNLRRVIMPGVKIVEEEAFFECSALADVECGNLEIINVAAFYFCESLKSINLPSVRIVKSDAFVCCYALVDAEFGNKLEIIEHSNFGSCDSLERITIPLKDGLFNEEDTFRGCDNLKSVDLVEGEVHETVSALHLDEWKNDMNEEIDSINRVLPDALAEEGWEDDGVHDYVEKAREIRRWIRSVLRKITHYQAEHRRVLDEAAISLQLALPEDTFMNNVLSFLELPPHTFEGDYSLEEEEDSVEEEIISYIYRDEVGEIIPREATHIFVGDDVTFVRARAFYCHCGIIEVICHDRVEKIEREAFDGCLNLRRVIMPGVKIVEEYAFYVCKELDFVECGKMEIIGSYAFYCESLKSIDLPSVRIVEELAFDECRALTNVKFGSKLERIEERAFRGCIYLERITVPLKDGVIIDDNIFQGCHSLRYVDLVEGEVHETIAALNLEEWRLDLNEEIESINRILPTARVGYARVGYSNDDDDEDPGEKAQMIRMWIRSVLDKIHHYKAEHRRILNDAATALQFVLSRDIVTNNVLSFMELPPREEE